MFHIVYIVEILSLGLRPQTSGSFREQMCSGEELEMSRTSESRLFNSRHVQMRNLHIPGVRVIFRSIPSVPLAAGLARCSHKRHEPRSEPTAAPAVCGAPALTPTRHLQSLVVTGSRMSNGPGSGVILARRSPTENWNYRTIRQASTSGTPLPRGVTVVTLLGPSGKAGERMGLWMRMSTGGYGRGPIDDPQRTSYCSVDVCAGMEQALSHWSASSWMLNLGTSMPVNADAGTFSLVCCFDSVSCFCMLHP